MNVYMKIIRPAAGGRYRQDPGPALSGMTRAQVAVHPSLVNAVATRRIYPQDVARSASRRHLPAPDPGGRPYVAA